MRARSRPIENGSSTSEVLVIGGHDRARSRPTPTLFRVVTIQRWTVSKRRKHVSKCHENKKQKKRRVTKAINVPHGKSMENGSMCRVK